MSVRDSFWGMRFAANASLIGCALWVVGLAGCSALLDTGSLTGGRSSNGSSGMSSGGDEPTLSDAGTDAGGDAGSPAAGGDESGGSAQAGSAGSSAGGSANGGGGGSASMAGGSAGGASAGAAGAPGACTKTNGGKEICDGVDNDCNAATPDCPAGCTAFVARGINYMACDKPDNWTSAEFACVAQNMLPVAILNAAENAAITAELMTLNLGASAWIGGDSDIQSNTTLEWPDGTIISKNGVPVAGVYHNFASGQPKNMTRENALQISISNDASAGQWSNALASVSQPFVCKVFGK